MIEPATQSRPDAEPHTQGHKYVPVFEIQSDIKYLPYRRRDGLVTISTVANSI